MVNAINKAETFIIIDPRMTGIGKEADYWLNVRPGTDQAIALAWAKIINDNNLIDELYMKRWTNAPFLVVEDMEPSGGWMIDNSGAHDMKTRLLKESDVVAAPTRSSSCTMPPRPPRARRATTPCPSTTWK